MWLQLAFFFNSSTVLIGSSVRGAAGIRHPFGVDSSGTDSQRNLAPVYVKTFAELQECVISDVRLVEIMVPEMLFSDQIVIPAQTTLAISSFLSSSPLSDGHVALHGGYSTRHFWVRNQSRLSLRSLELVHGYCGRFGCSGGAILVDPEATVSLTACVLSHNSGTWGGGLHTLNATVNMRTCNVTSNSAFHGGGIHSVS